MANSDSSAVGRDAQAVTGRVALWFANRAISILTTIAISTLLGGGAVLVALQSDVNDLKARIDGFNTDIEAIDGSVSALQESVNEVSTNVSKLGEKSDDVSGQITGAIGELKTQAKATRSTIEYLKKEVTDKIDHSVVEHNRFAKTLSLSADEAHNEILHQVSSGFDMLQLQQEASDEKLNHQINLLSEKIFAARSAVITLMSELVDSGKRAVEDKDKDPDGIDQWMTRVNYVIRSLDIPTEDGFFTDKSVVKKDLRKAIEKYRATGDLEHASAALSIVESMKDLAVAGRVP